MARTGENIYKRKDGRWEARYIKAYNEKGKALYGYVYANSYKAVREKRMAVLSELSVIKMNKTTSTHEVTYKYWIDEWLKNSKLRVKESTFIRYKNTVENHIKPVLGKYPISKISTSLMEQFIFDRLNNGRVDHKGGLSPKTIADILTIVKVSFKYAESFGMPIICSFERLSIKKHPREMRVFSLQEQKRLTSTLLTDMDRSKLGVLVCLYTGIRIGELCALKWENISLTEKTLRVRYTMQRIQKSNSFENQKTHVIITEPKSTAALRMIPLPELIVKELSRFESSPCSYLLTGENAIFVEPRTIQNRFKTFLKESKIENVNFHALRHTFATRCIEVGFDAKTLSEILGHSSVKITLDKYVHSSMDLKRSNMEKLQFIN